MEGIVIFVSGIICMAAAVVLIAGLINPNLSFFTKFGFLNDKSDGKKRLYIGLICFVVMWVSMIPVNLINNKENVESEQPVVSEPATKTINIEDDAVLMRFKNIYSKLLSFKDNPKFHLYGFGEGGDYHGWYMAAHNFTKEDDNHLMRTYGFVSGDLLMLGQEYIKSKGKETEFSKAKREEFERILSSKTWEIVE
jgi:hypothetical protein